jgi:hypothetical protein
VSIAHIAAEVENDHRESVMKLAQAHNVLVKTVHANLHKDLPLSGNGRRAIKLLYEETKKERSRMCQAITAMTATAF